MVGVAGFISDSLREQIRAASDIVDVIGSYIPLKRAGTNFTALCPFHKEKTPSFNVNPQKQIFHCFGCHKGGDVFTFVKEYENIGFVDALRRLAERAKIEIEVDNSPGAKDSRHLKDTLLQIHEQIAQRWQNCLATEAAGQAARDYLTKRGVSDEAIKVFRIGAAPELWDDTVNWAASKGYDAASVEKAGLIIKREGAEGHYDRFRGRLMFPICDEQGRVIGFSGRLLDTDAKAAKYVNSPETPIFTKSKVFFGLDKSKRAILDAGYAIVCEGQLDMIACFMAGVQNIVAPQGTAFTEQHARILKRYVDEVVLCFDSDAAGQNAAVRSHDSLLTSGLAVRVAVVPSPHDPDSFIKANGGEAFRKLVTEADGFFDFYLKRLCEQNDTTSDKGRLVVLRSMAETVQKTANRVLVDKYAQKTALRLGVTPESVRSEFAKASGGRSPVGEQFETEEELEGETVVEVPRPSGPELWLLKLVLRYETTMDWLVGHLDPTWIAHPTVREIVARRLSAHTENSWQGLAPFLDAFESADTRSLITEVTLEDRELPNPEQQLADLTLRLRNQTLDRQLAELTHRSSQEGVTDEERVRLLQETQQIRLSKRQPLLPISPF